MTEHNWRHEEIAALISRISIKTCDGFSEKEPSWICPGCGRSTPQIVASGPDVDVVACVYRHHDHIENLIARLLDRELPKPLSPDERSGRRRLKADLMRRLCRFKAVDVCHACNNVDTPAKSIVGAPSWFSFSPREPAVNGGCVPTSSPGRCDHASADRACDHQEDEANRAFEKVPGHLFPRTPFPPLL